MSLRQSRRKALSLALLSALALFTAPIGARAQTSAAGMLILGAGSTFAAPLYASWIKAFTKDKPGLSIDYDAVGSGEGVNRFITGSVDFAGTDAPLSDAELRKIESGALQVPSTAGMIVLAYNLSGVTGDLRLPRSLYPAILAGELRYWDDPRLVAANPGLKLPHRSIVVVARQDSSGTTYALARHLEFFSPVWRDSGLGVSKVVNWRGAMLAKGNEGVAQKIKISDGVIGYVEYGFAARLGLPMAVLENRAGTFVRPDASSGYASLDDAKDDPRDLGKYLADPAGEQTYPIVTLSWLLVCDRYRDPVRSDLIKEFVGFGLREGQSLAREVGYIPLPRSLTDPALRSLAAAT